MMSNQEFGQTRQGKYSNLSSIGGGPKEHDAATVNFLLAKGVFKATSHHTNPPPPSFRVTLMSTYVSRSVRKTLVCFVTHDRSGAIAYGFINSTLRLSADGLAVSRRESTPGR